MKSWRRFWRNRIEFYPAFSIFIWYAVGSVLSSLRVQNRPGIVTLGLITIPVVVVFIMAVRRTWRELPAGS
ncbi:MAG TPA: hypothetical protein PKY58_00405 [Syntrophales bacterium]|nr:hypothetical protein [Syntrophales bacterium]HQB29298.1 hypothetical protein [Syntrophales bacterium]HQN77176.1 hypothetical protein [Syntrophales bacterium]HQQ25957.1 hypothetical protein [Syntrophales bacterium]